jgi:hypothetical protein
MGLGDPRSVFWVVRCVARPIVKAHPQKNRRTPRIFAISATYLLKKGASFLLVRLWAFLIFGQKHDKKRFTKNRFNRFFSIFLMFLGIYRRRESESETTTKKCLALSFFWPLTYLPTTGVPDLFLLVPCGCGRFKKLGGSQAQIKPLWGSWAVKTAAPADMSKQQAASKPRAAAQRAAGPKRGGEGVGQKGRDWNRQLLGARRLPVGGPGPGPRAPLQGQCITTHSV